MPEHERSVASALKTVEALGKLTDRLRAGNSPINRAYRVVIRSLRRNLNDTQAIVDALETLEDSVRVASGTFYKRASAIGLAQAKRDLKIYDLGDPDAVAGGVAEAIKSSVSVVKEQGNKVISLARADLGDELILGDDSRQGVLRPSTVLGEMAFWLTAVSVLSYVAGTKRKMPEVVRQAVAQIDGNTTDTCLNVHGQIVGENEDFHLTGTPRYADDMYNPAFHRGCRTAVAHILPKYVKPDVTGGMRDEAIAQGKKPKPSTRAGKAHFKVVGKSVQEFRGGRWHKYKTYPTNIAARTAAARLNEARRS